MPDISEDRIFKILGTIYDIVQQPTYEPWIDVYKDMADLFGSGPGGISVLDKRSQTFSVLVGTIGTELIAEYLSDFRNRNPMRPMIAALNEGERYNRQLHIPDEEFRELPIYKRLFRRAGIFHFEYRAFIDHLETRGGLCFTRPDGHPNFSGKELTAMNFLMPHLARSFKLHYNLLDVHRENRAISEAFDHLPQGVIVVDRNRKLVFSNEQATALLTEGDGLRVDAKGIVKSSAPNSLFDRMIYNIFDQNASEPDKYGGVTAVTRPDGHRPLELLISPLKHSDLHGAGSETMAMIFVTDPERRTPDVAEILVKLYGMTRTEARLAALLAEGEKLSEICKELDISINTARTHLKHIFSKTDTNRQSELVKLILSGPANLNS